MSNETLIKCNETLSQSQSQIIDTFSLWISVFAYLLVGLVGFVLNLIAMCVLLSTNMWNNFFNRLLMCLSIFDSGFILCGLLELVRRQWSDSLIHSKLFVHFLYPFRSMVMCSSIYTTIVLTLERYQAISSPLEYRFKTLNANLAKRLCKYIVPVMLFSFVYYVPKFFDLYVKEETDCNRSNESKSLNTSKMITRKGAGIGEECLTEYLIEPTELRTHRQYIFWYLNVSNLLVTCIVPIGLLMFMNCRIAISLNGYRQRQPSIVNKQIDPNTQSTKTTPKTASGEVKQTFILFSIVILFVSCHALRIVMNITEFITLEKLSIEHEKGCNGISFWQHISMALSEFLLLFNSSAHFFVYLFLDKSFQQTLKDYYATIRRRLLACPYCLRTNAVKLDGQRMIRPEAKCQNNEQNDNEMEMNEVKHQTRVVKDTVKADITIEATIQNIIS